VPGGTNQQHAFSERSRPGGLYFLGSRKEIHDFYQFIFGFVDAGDIVEGDPRILFLIVAARPCSGRCP